MAARETHHRSLPVIDFLSADTYGDSSFQQMLKPSPLSLRTRESSSLALKHIFDQINSSADSAPFNNNNSNNSRAFEKKDNIEMHPLEKDGPSAAQGQAFFANNAVFGSPVSTQNASDNVNLPIHQGFLPRAVSRSNPSSPAIRQTTAQLTIFYSGTVNVYDDVPVDKANAIMLLAGTGNSWSTKPANEGDRDRISTLLNSPSPPPHVGTLAPVSLAMATPTATTTTATTTTSRAMGFTMPSAPSMATNTIINTVSTPPPPPQSPSLPAEAKQTGAPKRPHAGIELPHARKASLARFLEKRKDRVQVKQQQPGEEEKGEMSRDEKPKKPCMSLLSSPTGNSIKADNQFSSLPSTTHHLSADVTAAMMASNQCRFLNG